MAQAPIMPFTDLSATPRTSRPSSSAPTLILIATAEQRKTLPDDDARWKNLQVCL